MPETLQEKQFRSMVSRRIGEIRKLKGLTGYQIAEQIGCTQGLISHYETGQSFPPLPILVSICDALGCSVDYLLGRDADYSTTTPRGQLQSAFERLPSEYQVAVVKMAEALAATVT